MSDFNDKKDSDIKSRLGENVGATKLPKQKIPTGGKDSNAGAEGYRAKLSTPKTNKEYGSSYGPVKSESYSDPFQPLEQSGAIRPGSKEPVKAKQGNKVESGLLNLKAKIPKNPNDSSIGYEAKAEKIQNPKISDQNDYNTKIKDKFALSLRYRIPKKLASLESDDLHKLSRYISEQIEMNRTNRQDMLDRIFSFRESWRNFENAGLNITIDGQHNEHVPIIFQKGKDLHAKIYQAVLGVEPPFVMLPRKAVAEKVKQNKEDLLRWVTSDYLNKGEGIAVETDKDIWNFILDGTAVIKHFWTRDVRKFVDIESKERLPLELDENGQLVMDEKEIEKEAVVYDGPSMKIVPLEDIYIIGPKAEGIEDADMIAHRQYYSKSDLIKLSNLGFFNSEAIDKVLKYQAEVNVKVNGYDTELSQQEARLSGMKANMGGIPVYTVHECYLRYDIDKDGIDEELVVWRDWQSGIITRITYLDRVSPTGQRPFVHKKLIPLSGSCYGLGFGEMLFGINNLIDYIANQRLDAGTMQTFPWFVFRAGSGLQSNDVRLGPGKGIPVDNINDINFPRVNGNTTYGFQEEQLVTDYGDRVSGFSRFDPQSGQGITRTATGAATLAAQINTNLDVFIRRYQFGFKKSLGIIDKQCQELLPLGLEYRVLGMDKAGLVYQRFADRESIKFDCDYELVGNSMNSNPAIERDTAAQLMQYILNPVVLQSGIAGPKQVYNTLKNMLQKMGIRDINAYIQDPEGGMGSQFTAQDEINAIAAGVELPVPMNDDHAKKLEYYNLFEQSPEFGFLTAEHLPLYAKMKQAHEGYAQAIAAQAPVAANSGGMIDPALAASIAGSSGNPQGGVPNQISDLAPASSPTVNPE